MIRYADITINDRNPLKRKLQRIRLKHSLRILDQAPVGRQLKILDFGSGDATLDKYLVDILPNSMIYSFEPSIELREQARANVAGIPQVRVIGNLSEIDMPDFDYIFCLEVLEHLTDQAIRQALHDIQALCNRDTRIVIGVPNEIFLAAFLKGLFRLTRRWGEVDARPMNILKASMGLPLPVRPVGQLSEGVPYIFRHIGFDYRWLFQDLSKQFILGEIYGSPFPFLPLFFNFELYAICQLK